MADPVYNTPTVIAPTVPTVTPQQAYSPANVAQTLTSPVAKPDLSDPFATRNFYMNSPEIQAAKAQAQSVMEAINASRQGLRTTTTALQNQNEQAQGGTGASINLIGRQVGKARELTSNELSALSENQMAAQSYLDTLTQDANANYAIAEQQRAQVQDLIRQTGGKAGISYADNYESAIQKATKYQEKVAKKEKEDAYKESLTQTALQLGIKTKGLSKGEIEKKLKNYYKSEREYNEKVKQIELQAKQKSLSGSGSTAPGASAELNAVSSALKLNNNDWGATANYLADKGYDVSSGSVIDNELRRRNGLAPIVQQTPAQQNAEIAKQQEQENAKKTATKALDLVNSLETSSGKNAAIGAKGFTGGLLRGWVVPGTEAANFVSQFDSLKSLLTLENMGIMKGVLSDSDMKVIQQASTALNRNMSESEFDKELKKVKDVLSTKVGLSNEAGGLGTIVEKNGKRYRRVEGGWEEL